MAIVNVKTHGARGNGTADDTNAFNKALRAAQGGKLTVPAGRYMINAIKGIRPLSNTVIELNDEAVLEVIPNAETRYRLIRLCDCDDVTICGGLLKGDRRKHKCTEGEWGMGIHVGSGCSRITLQGVQSREMWGDGFYIGGKIAPREVTIRDCIADFNRRQGLSVVAGRQITIVGNLFSNTRGTRPENGIDIEPDRDRSGVSNVLIEGNRFINNGQVGIEIAGKWAPVSNITILNNHFDGQRPLKVKHVSSDYKQSSLSKLLCFFQSYRLEATDCYVH
jgi:Right handed beta helix region/Pectate lyase superfamily protein